MKRSHIKQHLMSAMIGATCAVTFLGGANAADLYQNASGLKDSPDAVAAPLTGFYLGAKIGGSVLDLSDRSVKYGAFDYTEDSVRYTAGDQKWDTGSGTDAVIGGGVMVGYNLNGVVGLPVRAEFDYVARGKGSVDQAHDVIYDLYSDGEHTPRNARLGQNDKIGVQTTLMSLYLDIPIGAAITPYVGGGVGAAFIDHETTVYDDDGVNYSRSHESTNFAWAVGGGLAWAIDGHKTIDISYRYVDAGDSSVKKGNWEPISANTSIATHDVMLGFRYGF